MVDVKKKRMEEDYLHQSDRDLVRREEGLVGGEKQENDANQEEHRSGGETSAAADGTAAAAATSRGATGFDFPRAVATAIAS